MGGLTTYNVIISRTLNISGALNNFNGFEDRYYGFQQTSSSTYYYWKRLCLSYIKNINGAYTTDVLVHLAAQHSTRTKEI